MIDRRDLIWLWVGSITLILSVSVGVSRIHADRCAVDTMRLLGTRLSSGLTLNAFLHTLSGQVSLDRCSLWTGRARLKWSPSAGGMSDLLTAWGRPQWVAASALEPSRGARDKIIFRHEVNEHEPLPLSDRVSIPLVLKSLGHNEGEGHLKREAGWALIRTRLTERLQAERAQEDSQR